MVGARGVHSTEATEPERMLSSWAEFLADEPMKPRDAATSPSL